MTQTGLIYIYIYKFKLRARPIRAARGAKESYQPWEPYLKN